MKIGCGTDIIEISRIKQIIEKKSERFIKRIFTEEEIKYCESKNTQKYHSYAGKFAAKEAALKAISIELKDKYSLGWKDIEITNEEQGRPKLYIKGIDMKNIENMDVSISHCKQYAIANVSILFNERGKK